MPAIIFFCILLICVFGFLIFDVLPDDVPDKINAFIDLIGVVGTFGAFLIAVAALLYSARSNRLQAKEMAERDRFQRSKQHTVTILFESRLSPEFRRLNALRRSEYPAGDDILYSEWSTAYFVGKQGSEQKTSSTDAARALIELLNYYEFLALGIAKDDLDEELLKKSLRGIMCALVDDARDVIFHLREKNIRTYENLSDLYEQWRDKSEAEAGRQFRERPIACACAQGH